MSRKPSISYSNFIDFKDRSGKWVKNVEVTTDSSRILYRTRAYCVWMSITSRYSKSKSTFVANAYKDVEIKFKDFQEFAEWCQTQEGYWNRDEKGRFWQIDKDLLSEGTGIYSKETCVFIPSSLNSLLPRSPGSRKGPYAQGVSWHIRCCKFRAASSKNSKIVNLGNFDTEHEAHRAWQEHKISVLTEVIDSGIYSDKVKYGLERIRDRILSDFISNIETVI